MSSIDRAQTGDMEMLTRFADTTRQDTLDDLNYMSYVVPRSDVKEILGIIAAGVSVE